MRNAMKNTATPLELYADLLTTWNKKLNLVSPNTIGQLWQRHIEDCTQLVQHIPAEKPVYDLGSGAGLPGLILSILGYEVTLVESDSRKCVFLQEAARVCGVHPTILNQRVETVAIPEGAVVTARAFAPLAELFKLSNGFRGDYVLLKGEQWQQEVTQASQKWDFGFAAHPSRSGPGFVLIINGLQERV